MLDSALNLLTNPLVLVGAGIAAMGTFAVKATKETVAYNKEIREMTQVIGLGADETSRIVQVADDWGITIGEVRTSLAFMNKQGVTPSIDNLAKLADEYVTTTDKSKFAEKAVKILGRGYQTLIPLLAKGGDALRKQTDAVDESLIATDKSIAASREYEAAQDKLKDNVEGLSRTIGNKLIPVLNDVLGFFNAAADGAAVQADTFDLLREAYEKGIIPLGEFNALMNPAKSGIELTTEKIGELESQLADLEVQLDKTGKAEGYWAGILAENATPAVQDYADANNNVATAITNVTAAAFGREALDVYNQLLKDGTIDQDEYNRAAVDVMTTLLDMSPAEADAALRAGELASAYRDGTLDALGFAQANVDLGKSMDYILDLDGRRATLYVDVVQTGGVTVPGVVEGGVTVPGGIVDPGTGSVYRYGPKPVPPTNKEGIELRAEGGPVMPGGRYIVGEAGPETLVMGQSGGYVIPNNTTNNNNTWNVYTNGGQQVYERDYNLRRALAN
jgi:hypothetical protein